MRKIIFNASISLDGFFEGPNHELDWHNVDTEHQDYSAGLLSVADLLLFGRVTYELMASFWPTERGREVAPAVAEKMNGLQKIVYSRTLDKAGWNNTRLEREAGKDDILALKQQPGKDILILGSSDLAVGFLENGLIDEYRLIVVPIFLGSGKRLFSGLDYRSKLRLSASRVFGTGNVLLSYVPAT